MMMMSIGMVRHPTNVKYVQQKYRFKNEGKASQSIVNLDLNVKHLQKYKRPCI